ncbi:MAG: branched-chain amino acid ABC transporter permease [Chloroflexota bacterium]|nr:branched-chain amino acid ABC transporter permease [Chloroflexota bacterium]
MTTQTAAPQTGAWATFKAWLARPAIAGAIVVGYVILSIGLVVTLNRGSLWYPLANICAFPLLVIAPIVVLGSPLPGRLKLSIILGLIIVILPVIGVFNTSYLELAIQISIFAGLALGLNVVIGFAGLLDLGYIAFFAVGAYLWAMFTSPAETIFQINGWLVPDWAFFIFILLAVGAAGLVGILLGLPVLRLRGDYLAIVTLGFGEMIRILARNADQPINLTNGAQGLHNIGRPPLPGFAVDFTNGVAGAFGITLNNPDTVARQLMFYFLSIGLLFIVILVARRLENSAIGRAWTAIREDETAAIAMGVPLVRMKLLAFATGASFAGAIGVLYAAKQTFIDPSSFVLIQSITILAMVIVGGMGGIRGVILGAMVITLLDLHILANLSLQLNALRNIDFVIPILNFHIRDWPSQLEPSKYQPFVFGLILVLMMIFRPAGLLPEPRRKMELLAEKIDPTAPITGEVKAVPTRAPSGD